MFMCSKHSHPSQLAQGLFPPFLPLVFFFFLPLVDVLSGSACAHHTVGKHLQRLTPCVKDIRGAD